MHTLSFYSYKGGVGRSLAVYYMAEQLAKRGKKVVVADFDFEAPGLPYKFNVKQEDIKRGMVDYVHHFTTNRKLPESLVPYLLKVEMRGRPKGEVWMLPAGAAMERSYWRMMNEIDWHHLVYGQKGIGVLFFWEWKLRMEAEFKPDVLLIDARTGVTDLSTITLQLLADQVIVLGANNEENLDGCRLIMEALERAPKFEFKENPKCHFLLTRLPAPNKNFSDAAEGAVVDAARRRLNANRPELNPLVNEMIVIHSDYRLMIDEKRLSNDPRKKIWRIEREYLRLMELVFRGGNLLSSEEMEELRIETDVYYWLDQAERTLNSKQKLECLIKALDVDGKSISAMIEIASVSKNEQHIEKLDRTIRLMVETNSVEADDLFNYAYLMGEIENYQDCIWGYSQYIDFEPFEAAAYNNIGIAYLEIGDMESALENYCAAISLQPNDTMYLVNRGRLYVRKKEFELAIVDFTYAINIQPDIETMHRRGFAYFSDKKYELGLKDFDKIIELDPGNYTAFYHRGRVLYRMKQFDRSIENFSKSIEIEPSFYKAFLLRGSAYYAIAEYSDAIKDLAIAIGLKPENERAYFMRGVASAKINDYEMAIGDFTKVVMINPHHAEALNNRGFLLAKNKAYDLAILDFNKAIDLNPKSALSFRNRGAILRIQGKFAEALVDATASILLKPTEGLTFCLLAEIHSALDNTDLFYESLQKALDLDSTQIEKLDQSTLARHQHEEKFQALLQKYKPR